MILDNFPERPTSECEAEPSSMVAMILAENNTKLVNESVPMQTVPELTSLDPDLRAQKDKKSRKTRKKI